MTLSNNVTFYNDVYHNLVNYWPRNQEYLLTDPKGCNRLKAFNTYVRYLIWVRLY